MSWNIWSIFSAGISGCSVMALRNSAREIVPESSSSILTKSVRSSSSLDGGVEKAIDSSASFLRSSAWLKASRASTTSLCMASSCAASMPEWRVDACLIHGWAMAPEAGRRSRGLLCIRAWQKSLASCDTRSHSGPVNLSGSCLIIRAFSLRSWWWKGLLPERSMYVTTPMAHMSTLESYSLPDSDHSSGAMYEGVPSWSHMASLPGATSAAKPKSMSLSSASSSSFS
mmetsp:Transcript_11911/g.20378  ORF Transcript_11911/g.20378 Transcript_11911/m.20378 type:complete len:228 (-) Transcript_11911:705-1388(-)